MNLNLWFDIPSKYIENFYVIVSVALLGIFSERLTDTSCQEFSLWFFCGISLALVKTDVKNVCWRVSFSRPGLPFFFFFLYLCHSPTTCYSWVLFLKQEVAHCILSFWLVCVMPGSSILILFPCFLIFFQIESDVTVLSLHATTGFCSNQKQLIVVNLSSITLSLNHSFMSAVGEETSEPETSYCLRWKLFYYSLPSHLTPENFFLPLLYVCVSFYLFSFPGLLRLLLQICSVWFLKQY